MLVVMALVVTSTASALTGTWNTRLCQGSAWTRYVTAGGAPFASRAGCVSYVNGGGALKRTQTVAFTSANPSPVAVGATYTPRARATSKLPVTITVDAASSAVCSKSGALVTFNGAGTCTLNARQSGNTVFVAAPRVQQAVTVTAPVPVTKESQTVAFTSTNPSPVTVGATYTPTASATSGLTVEITVDAASAGACSLSSGVVTFDAAGTCTIDADQPGDAAYDAAPQAQQSITVTEPAPVTSQAKCEALGGTYGTEISLWTCKGLPSSTEDPRPALADRCNADGGAALTAAATTSGGWDVTCYGAAIWALLLAVGGAVAGALYAAFHDGVPA
jgi:hypothetical protein